MSKSLGKTEFGGKQVNGNTFTASNSVSASGTTIDDSLNTAFNTSIKLSDFMIDNINPKVVKITDYKMVLEIENDIDTQQKELQSLTENDYYYTYYDKNYITYEPVRYLNDCFSVSFNFWFSKEEEIIPYFYFVKDGVTSEHKLNTINTKIDSFNNISFGPFQKLFEENRPTEVYIAIKTSTNIIFFKHHKILDFDSYSYATQDLITQKINLNVMLTSCWAMPGYRFPAPLEPELYTKLTNMARDVEADFLISLGDLLYLQPLSITSEISLQCAYAQFKEYSRFEGLFSNSTWLICNDDHEFSRNDGNKNSPILKLLRNKFSDNFPLVSEVSTDFRSNISITKNITFITLDTVSGRKLNPNPKDKYDKFLSILGEDQLECLLNGFSNVYSNFDANALCFVLVGKTMFGEQGEGTFLYCPSEREKIFNYIKDLGLRNVCFLCGDSHFSDVSEYIVNNNTNQIIREIRCSAIGSVPRKGDINESRVPGSLVSVNNFGKMNIEGTYNNYTITYEDYTLNDVAYKYSWNIKYK
jgi:hypothetical protein